MTEKVIPLYANYSLLGSKKQDYLDFKRVAELMNDKGSFNPSPQPTQPPGGGAVGRLSIFIFIFIFQ